jgi:hypothetical protein
MPGITISNHLIQQAAAKGISLAAIEAVLDAPGIKYPSFRKDSTGKRFAPLCDKHGVQQEKWTGTADGQKVCIVVYPCCGKAITVWLDQIETAIRPDQRQQGVARYQGRDGKWRS